MQGKINFLQTCREMRKDIVRMTYSVGNTGAHIGGSLSLVEIFAALYFCGQGVHKDSLFDTNRRRIILSKGHGIMAQYAAMKQADIIDDETLMTFKKPDSALQAHPSKNDNLGIEFSSGSLGQGLSQGVGVALALEKKNNDSEVYVVVGDGECDEGSVWEAAMSAAHFKLKNLTVIVDVNHLQYDGDTKQIMNLESLENKWQAFGWEVVSVDGHSVESIGSAMLKKAQRPKAIIADTIKGKGISFMENNPQWHNGRLTQELFEKAMVELGEGEN